MANKLQQAITDKMRALKNLVPVKPIDGNGVELFTTGNPANVKFPTQQNVNLNASAIPLNNPVPVKMTDGTNELLYTNVGSADSLISAKGITVSAYPALYNGATWDRVRNNTQGTLISSGTRNTTVASANQTNYNHRGIIICLNVTVASGTGGLITRVYGLDSVNQNWMIVSGTPTAVTGTGTYIYTIYPSATTQHTQNTNCVLPRTWLVQVTHNDATNYSYSIGYSLIL